MNDKNDWLTCPCCGYKTITTTHDICDICRWEHDTSQEAHPYEDDMGPNGVTLKQGQENYLAVGACERCVADQARKPTPDDIKDPQWRPLQ